MQGQVPGSPGLLARVEGRPRRWGVKMDGTTVSRDGARNLGEVRTGVEGKLNDRLSVWGSVGVQMGDKGYSDTQGMLGVKYNW